MLLTRIALAPLRETTRAIESVDERNLGARLALRGTDDDIDRLGKALNRVFERLENAFARMRSYGADVAHELRTPLNRLVNLVDVALLPNSGERAERTLEAVREATQEMQRLIEDMLLLARGEEERLRLLPEKLDLVAAARDLVELYSPACDERGVTLALTAAPGASELETDRSLLQRALANLLDNAVRHTPSGGRIDVTVAVEGERATISVDDSGPGIAAAERERVFERFVQLDPARGHSGAGLGLPIARMIARLLGGSLTVTDSPLGGARLQLALRSLGSSRIHAR
jgi:signal transduction histidine kinase